MAVKYADMYYTVYTVHENLNPFICTAGVLEQNPISREYSTYEVGSRHFSISVCKDLSTGYSETSIITTSGVLLIGNDAHLAYVFFKV